jgi:hypothetical protein
MHHRRGNPLPPIQFCMPLTQRAHAQIEYVGLKGKVQRVNSEDLVVVFLEPECNSKAPKKRKDDEHDKGGSGPKQTPVGSRIPIPKKTRCST